MHFDEKYDNIYIQPDAERVPTFSICSGTQVEIEEKENQPEDKSVPTFSTDQNPRSNDEEIEEKKSQPEAGTIPTFSIIPGKQVEIEEKVKRVNL